MLTMKYSEVMNFNFAQTMQVLTSARVHGNVASQIHKVTTQVDRARTRIIKEFQDEIVENFGKRDEEKKIIRPEGEPRGFEVDETKQDEFEKVQKAFDERTVELKATPFTIQLLGDIKISAQDLKALGPLYVGNAEEVEEKPALPKDNVQSLR